ncbi:SpoIIE family protein phosphatase [Streptomyces sp. NPDC049577]|uniref:SpoIIE family protein phosphatase n=1 Tax=Streptomyces sp. NPDC049577 TaxID=3155153 RepID=UPI0034335270
MNLPADRPAPAASFRERAFDQSPIATSVFDRDNRLVDANEEMVRLAGKPLERMLGLRLADVHPYPPFDEYEETAARVLRTGEPVRTDSYFRAPGERRRRGWATFFTPLRDDAGEVCGVALRALDITPQYRARHRLVLVNDTSTRIGATLDVHRIARELTASTVGKFADTVTVDLLDGVIQGEAPPSSGDGTVTLCRAAQRSVEDDPDAPADGPDGTRAYAADSPPARALAAGRPVCLHLGEPGVREWAAGALPADLGGDPERGLLLTPLRARDLTLGLVTFVRHGEREPFDHDDLLLAEEIAVRAATCLDNARRYVRERTIALTLQRELLPSRLPARTAVAVASRYLPAGTQAGVGGDWFDVIPLSGARVALVVGDVVGHGLRATATMGRLRAAVRTLADLELPPEELLTHLDDLVLQLGQEHGRELGEDTGHEAARMRGGPAAGDFVATCLYLVYNPVSRRCSLASAGHPAPALRSADGTVEYLDLPAGPPLGVGGLPFEASQFDLPDGCLLALFTDGLLAGEEYDLDAGAERLRGLLAAPPDSLEETCDCVLDALLPAHRTDDVALLLARPQGLDPSRVRCWDLPADPAAVADVRKYVAEQLATWGLDELTFTTELVVSELVTNAIRYAAPPIALRLIRDATLICEVSDGTSTSPRLRRARTYDEGGRGLLLVAQLTERWGTRFTAGGKTIWAEQALPPEVEADTEGDTGAEAEADAGPGTGTAAGAKIA